MVAVASSPAGKFDSRLQDIALAAAIRMQTVGQWNKREVICYILVFFYQKANPIGRLRPSQCGKFTNPVIQTENQDVVFVILTLHANSWNNL
jgi:hypothetical protein